MADSFGDIYTWLHDVAENRVFRFWVFRRIFTPYEQEQKFSDESQYEDNSCKLGYIRELINLENGDYLIGFELVINEYGEVEDTTSLEYYKFSEIRLAYDENDVIPIDER